jgi:hypothetical protein
MDRRRALVAVASVAAGAPLAMLPTPARADLDITNLRVEREGNALFLYAAMPMQLPSVVDDMLAKGIAMYFVAEVEIIRERWYWTDLNMAKASRTWRLAFQPLSRRWRLTVSSKDAALTQNFDSKEEALATISRIARWRIAEGAGADDPRNTLTFRFRLDTSQLPRPLQMGLVGQPDWNMSASRSLSRFGASQ